MSQVDQLIYVPLLLWFIVFLFLYYIQIWRSIVPLIYTNLSLRYKFFLELIKTIKEIRKINIKMLKHQRDQ